MPGWSCNAAEMLPLADLPTEVCRNLIGVFTDIDDTLTTEGAITDDALEALAQLKEKGLHVIPITGRPVGWSEPFALEWPVDAIVAENGAVALQKNKISSKNTCIPASVGHSSLSKLYQQDAATRASNFQKMQQVAQRVLREVPGSMLAQDSPGRETDIAIDHSEFTHLPPEKIAQALQIMQAEGMNATVSSIHINAWFGSHNKLTGARWIVRALLQRNLDAELGHWLYVGDSTNDQVMFEAFPHSVGVANIARFLPQLNNKPRYVTQGARGAGFAQVAAMICAAI